jgi:hypothetical protein
MVYKRFEHPDFTLEVPMDWILVPSSVFEAVFVMPPFPDGPGSNVSVSITKGIKPTSIYEVADKLKTMQQEQYPNYQVLEEGIVTYPERQGYGRYYTWENTDTQLPIAQSQVIFAAVSGHEIAVLTATRPVDLTTEDVVVLNTVYGHMITTFEFNNAS